MGYFRGACPERGRRAQHRRSPWRRTPHPAKPQGPGQRRSLVTLGDRIVTTGQDQTTKVWDATTGDELLVLSGFDGPVTFVLWSADGTRLITHSNDGLGRVWDASASSPTYGEALVTFTGHTSSVWRMSWSPAGDRLLTGCMDGTARVWDINSGVELVRYAIGGMTDEADWSPDGTRIVVAHYDGTARVFPAWQTTQELIDYAKECCVVRELTDDERQQFGLRSRQGN